MIVNSPGSAEMTVGTVIVTPQTSTTTTRTDVSRSVISQTFLSINSSRKGATIHNDSNGNLFIKCGITASTTDFLARLGSQDYFELPFNYTGRVDGVWSNGGAGNARITEFT